MNRETIRKSFTWKYETGLWVGRTKYHPDPFIVVSEGFNGWKYSLYIGEYDSTVWGTEDKLENIKEVATWRVEQYLLENKSKKNRIPKIGDRVNFNGLLCEIRSGFKRGGHTFFVLERINKNGGEYWEGYALENAIRILPSEVTGVESSFITSHFVVYEGNLNLVKDNTDYKFIVE